ncbi:MAG: hypothetical protein PHI70_01360 [Proteiniphilum sp.]|nr:hypothetical protein [Proteiniphilum sp.]MDD4415428.1 hypothetical protein [Proteiniphilum sp.]
MKTKLFTITLMMVVTIGWAAAQNQDQTEKVQDKTIQAGQTIQRGPAFVDSNNNGICDNYEKGTPGNPNANGRQALRNGSGRGRGMGFGNGQGRGRYFIDTDGNGVCDNFEKGTPRRGRGAGYRAGIRNGRGRGINFVDANKNGICDWRETK